MFASSASARLSAWRPEDWPVDPGWQAVLDRFLSAPQGQALGEFIANRLQAGATVYPPQPFRALALTPKQRTRVVILGQDPYHGAGQAEGLAFSVPDGQRLPPSLRNIYKELEREAELGLLPARTQAARSGSLVSWAKQGVLLLNTSLTVEDGAAGSHAKRGWEDLTLSILAEVSLLAQPVAILLWGAHAQQFQARLGPDRHGPRLLLCANHPSPLSASRGPSPFLGCDHFAQVNKFLASYGQQPIQW